MHLNKKNHSPVSNLLESLQDWSISLNSHLYTDIGHTDFSKAFDPIVQSKLLKLHGITKKIAESDYWICV